MRLLTKEGKALSTWLDELYEILRQLSVLGSPKTVAQIRLTILGALKRDARYTDVLRDLKRNPHWSVPKIRLKLEAAATGVGHLLPRMTTSRVVNAAKRQEEDSDSEAELETQSQQRRMRRKATAALRARAHPDGGPQPTARAEGRLRSPGQLERLAKEPCLKYQFDLCTRGDSCYRAHVKLSEPDKHKLITSLKAKSKDPNPFLETLAGLKPGEALPLADENACYSFLANGVCSFGEGCKFSHVSPKKAHTSTRKLSSVRFRRTTLGGVAAKVGDLITRPLCV